VPRSRPGPARPSESLPAFPTEEFEAEVLPGLVPFARAELRAAGAKVRHESETSLLFEHRGGPKKLLALRRCVAVYALLRFDVPRPRALLGHAHLGRLTGLLASVLIASPGQSFNGFRFGAAGSDSPVFLRLADEISRGTGLPYRREDGELLLRVRPGAGGGWQVLARLTPRPLSAREWRACNRPGGLNATVAAAANDLLGVSDDDSYLNLMCGSGTLIVERALAGRLARGVALDLDPGALACAAENLALAGLAGSVELLQADATDVSLPTGEFDRLSADLPWGDAVGGHEENRLLYPRFLREAGRLAVPGARMLAITHELRIFEQALAAQTTWRSAGVVRVFHGGHRPGLYLLQRER
jgi:tRNA (guanine6-N2)-methyltransferase